MRRNLFLLVILVLVIAILAGCSAGPKATPVPPTKTPKPTFTLTPNWTPTPLPIPTATPVPATPTPAVTNTPVPTPVPPTATPTPPPRFTTTQAVNVRQGPGTAFARIGEMGAGQAYDIIGVSPARDWLQFTYNGQPAWVYASLVTVTGDLSKVQLALNIPLPPAPPALAPPTAIPQPAATAAPSYTWMYVSGSAVAAPQCGAPYFRGQVQNKDGGAQNGVCVYIGYYGPRQIKYSGSGGSGDGNWGFAPCGQGDCKGTIEIYVVACPSGIDDGGVSYGGSGSPPAQQSDKFTVTITDKCTAGQWTNIIFKKTS